jgi:hypothetical protein
LNINAAIIVNVHPTNASRNQLMVKTATNTFGKDQFTFSDLFERGAPGKQNVQINGAFSGRY